MCCFGDQEDLRHSLPRMVELSLNSAFRRRSVLMLADQLPLSAHERALVNAVFADGVLAQLRTDELDDSPLTVIAVNGLAPQAASLLESATTAPRWYAELICELGRRQFQLTQRESVLADWVLTHPKLEALERAFFAAKDPATQQLFSIAVQVLEWF